MECRIEGTLMDLEEVSRYLLKTLRDRVAVAGTQSDNLQDQHVESPLQKLDLGFTHNYT